MKLRPLLLGKWVDAACRGQNEPWGKEEDALLGTHTKWGAFSSHCSLRISGMGPRHPESLWSGQTEV